jgi:cytidylate kinase
MAEIILQMLIKGQTGCGMHTVKLQIQTEFSFKNVMAGNYLESTAF